MLFKNKIGIYKMNIYGIFFGVFLFLNAPLYDSIMQRNFKTTLYMKKSKGLQVPIYIPKSINQEEYVKHLNNDNTKIIISTGPAGCGKTLFACQKAVLDLKAEKINKIIITRPVVSVDEEIGFLPGNIIKKMDPWTKPIFDIFLEYYSKNELDLMLINGKVEICPLAFMRGRTFKHAFIIADEMQNSSPNQMKMLTTRLGENTRMVITGDLHQTDLLKENGLYDFVEKVKRANDTSSLIKFIKLDNSDIERSDIVKKVIEIYDNVRKPETNLIQKNDTIIEPQNDTKVEKKYNNVNNINDAALIPMHHMSQHHDIFSYKLEF
jgi:phosphate starvation-inducible PhoH-like protein